MTRSVLIVFAMVLGLVAGGTGAFAKTHVDFGVSIGTPGYYPYDPYYSDYPYYPYRPSHAYGYYPAYGDSCQYVTLKKWVKRHGEWRKKYVTKLVCY